MPSISLPPSSGRYLSFAEREEIAILHVQLVGVREIARRLGRSPSTISRELRRNASTRSHSVLSGDDGAVARRAAREPPEGRRSSPRTTRCVGTCRSVSPARSPDRTAPRWRGLRCTGSVGATVAGRIGAGRGRGAPSRSPIGCAVEFPDDPSMRISHEAIYQSLYVQGRGALRRELTACLRTGRALRVPRARTHGRGKKFVPPEIMISRAARRGRRPRRPRPLGGRPDPRARQLRDRHAGRADAPGIVMLLHLPRMNGHGDGLRVQQRASSGRARRRGRPRRDRRLDQDAARAAAHGR